MKLSRLICAVMVLGLAGMVIAHEDAPKKKKKARPKGIVGKIVKIDGTNIVIAKRTRGEKKATEVTVATDDKTKFRVDRKEATLADLKPGMFAMITPETGTAQRVFARTKGPKGPKDGKDGKRPKRKPGKKKPVEE